MPPLRKFQLLGKVRLTSNIAEFVQDVRVHEVFQSSAPLRDLHLVDALLTGESTQEIVKTIIKCTTLHNQTDIKIHVSPITQRFEPKDCTHAAQLIKVTHFEDAYER
jgi:hypothetical protein